MVVPEYVPNEGEKIELLKQHFYYEIQLLSEAAALWYALNYSQSYSLGYTLPNFPPSLRRLINNMCLEAVPMHARGLIPFFTSELRGRGGRDKDALAKDFIRDGETWTRPVIDQANYPNLKLISERTDKELAHLSYERVPAAQLQTHWDLAGVTIEISSMISAFIPKCKEEYVSPEIRTLVTHLENLVVALKQGKASGIIP